MTLTGDLFIGRSRIAATDHFHAVNPSTGETLAPAFSAGGAADVERACALAEAAFAAYASTDREARAVFLERAADAIMALGDALLERAYLETGLPLARLTGERGRTVGQLKLFAAEVRDGAWMGLRIDHALPDRKPLPRSDIRMRKIAVGPVAVFGASNFPLAFSVAGGDTASALAAGCPVVVKGHPAHPGTCEMIASAIISAAAATGLPEGVFSMLNGPAHELGGALVADPRICAVGFTGSRGGGLALARIAANRPLPIPVYAEMSAINPVLLLPGALSDRAEALGREFVGSLTLGAGQFCTNPGLVLAINSPALDRFLGSAAEAIGGAEPAAMLTPGIHTAYEAGVKSLSAKLSVATLARGKQSAGPNRGSAALFGVSADDFLADDAISQEVFGASSVLVRCASTEALKRVVSRLEGQLTATLQVAPEDHALAAQLIPMLERKVGRLIVNGWPTGVEVCHAMVHGGPFPATSDGRTTSVGTLAIDRFLRPVCYQDVPADLLPAELRDRAGFLHRVDGEWRTA
jgi:2,5-dioxopentanoate dehydrogenase